MHVIAKKTLKAFWETYADAATPLAVWYKTADAAAWESIADVRLTYAHADFVDPYTIFNIKGNDYRLIVKINYGGQLIFIHKILTHAEYDKEAWK